MNSSHNFKDSPDAIHAGVMATHGSTFGVGAPAKPAPKPNPYAGNTKYHPSIPTESAPEPTESLGAQSKFASRSYEIQREAQQPLGSGISPEEASSRLADVRSEMTGTTPSVSPTAPSMAPESKMPKATP